jgi:hypothetical protein
MTNPAKSANRQAARGTHSTIPGPVGLMRAICAPLAALVVVLGACQASAVELLFNGGPNTQPPFHNPGAPPQDVNLFTTDFDLANAALTFSMKMRMKFHVRADLGIFGIATFDPTGDLNFPTKTQPLVLNGGGLHLQTSPTGSAQLSLWNEQIGAGLPSHLTNAELTGLETTLVAPGHGSSVSTNTVSMSGSGSLTLFTVLGYPFTVDLNAKLTGSANVAVNSLSFQQTGPNALVLPLSAPPPNAPDQSVAYLMSAEGIAYGSYTLGASGSLSLSVSGNNAGSFPLFVSETTTASDETVLPGIVQLADLNPTGYDPVYHDDLQATLGLAGLTLALPDSPLSTVGTAILISTVSYRGNIGVPISATGSVTASVTFGVLGTLRASGIGYQLQDSIAGVIVPEPESISLLFVGLALALPVVFRRLSRGMAAAKNRLN